MSEAGGLVDDELDYYFAEPTYSEISQHINETRAEVENLDQDSLVDELSGLQFNIKGSDSRRIQNLIYKVYANGTLTDSEMQFLKNIYVIYYCKYAVVVDEPEEDLIGEF